VFFIDLKLGGTAQGLVCATNIALSKRNAMLVTESLNVFIKI
jgi:hypothetical protein